MPLKNDQERPCPRCEGTGRCVDCQGTGKAVCPSCQGEGQKASPRGPSYPCKTCGGSGRIDCPPRCPSCDGSGTISQRFQKEIQQKYQVSFANYTPTARVVGVLVALNVVIYLVTARDLPSLVPPPIPQLVWGALANYPDSAAMHEYWRFLTPAFLHAGWWHLGFNMWFLISFGPPLEGVYGSWRFLLLYGLAALGGNLLSWAFNPLPGIGASTALFGLGAAYVGLRWRWGMWDEGMVSRLAWMLGGLIVLGFMASSLVALDNWGHLGGALAGLAFAYVAPRPRGH